MSNPDDIMAKYKQEYTKVIANICEQLAWRGPTGKKLGHVVIERQAAEVLVAYRSLVGEPEKEPVLEPLPAGELERIVRGEE